MRTRTRWPRRALGSVLALALTAVAPAGAAVGRTTRVSIGSAGQQANGASPAATVADRSGPELSLDGLKIAFSSDASNLVSGDTNRESDVFVRDTTTGKTWRVSVSSSERQANGPSHSPAISVDGRYVAFVSAASNLVPGDTNGVEDVFLRDRKYGRTVRVSLDSRERQLAGASRAPGISLFGDYVVFESTAILSAGDRNAHADAFVRDVRRGTTSRIAPPADTAVQKLPGGVDDPTAVLRTTWSASPSISYDGRFVAYVRATAERAQASPSALDVFVYDRQKRTHTQIAMAPWMGAARVLSDNPAISADGRYVAFEAWSVLDSVAGSDEALLRNPLDVKDVYVWDRAIGGGPNTVTSNSWSRPANGDSYAPSISAGGQYVAFVSDATNLVAGDTNGAPDVFVRDNIARTTSRMSVGASAAQGADGGLAPSISYEGRRVAYASTSRNFTGGDTNGASDVFVHDRRTDVPNTPPRFSRVSTPRTINPTEATVLRLRARDRDGDPVRFSLLEVTHQRQAPALSNEGLPMGSTLDPTGGTFRWTPTPDQAGTWRLIFWAGDPRGAVDFFVWDVVVRSADRFASCRAQATC